MLCEETRPLFSLYVDDGLSLPVRAALDEHLGECPLCRARLGDLRALKQSLRALARPVAPLDLVESISEALAIEAAARRLQPRFTFRVRAARWLEPKLMPYT